MNGPWVSLILCKERAGSKSCPIWWDGTCLLGPKSQILMSRRAEFSGHQFPVGKSFGNTVGEGIERGMKL